MSPMMMDPDDIYIIFTIILHETIFVSNGLIYPVADWV